MNVDLIRRRNRYSSILRLALAIASFIFTINVYRKNQCWLSTESGRKNSHPSTNVTTTNVTTPATATLRKHQSHSDALGNRSPSSEGFPVQDVSLNNQKSSKKKEINHLYAKGRKNNFYKQDASTIKKESLYQENHNEYEIDHSPVSTPHVEIGFGKNLLDESASKLPSSGSLTRTENDSISTLSKRILSDCEEGHSYSIISGCTPCPEGTSTENGCKQAKLKIFRVLNLSWHCELIFCFILK